MQRARIEIIVFDRITGAHDLCVLAALHRAHERELNVEWQRCRDAVRIDLLRRQSFGLEKDLMTVALRETNDFVFDRWTIARADALDDAGK